MSFTINNPVPSISSLSPTSGTAGSSGFTLTVNGSNFVNGASVNWNGSSRTTTFVSSTQLTASILASDITTAGTATVTVTNPTPGGGTSNAQTFTVKKMPVYAVSRTSVNMGSVALNSLKTDTVTIWNKGTDTLKITNITSTNTEYSATPTVKNIPPSGSLVDTIKFIPTAIGSSSAKLLVASNDATTPDTINVTGYCTGKPVCAVSRTSVNMGTGSTQHTQNRHGDDLEQGNGYTEDNKYYFDKYTICCRTNGKEHSTKWIID